MADIFGFNYKKANNFKDPENGEGVLIGNGSLLLVQQWSVQYQLQVQPIYECGTSTVYFTAKHGSGTLSVTRIVAENFSDIKKTLGDICNPETVKVKALSGQCNGTSEVNALLEGTMLVGVNLDGQAANAYVGEQLTANFVSMS